MDTTTTDLQRTSRLFHALADDTRLQVVQMLAREELCVCELQGAVGAYQSRLSFHLKRLKEVGLVNDRKVGRWVYYSLRPEALEEMKSFLRGIEDSVAAWPPPAEGCCS